MAFCSVGDGYCGPLPHAAQGKKFLIIAIDYFTKWVEAEPLSTITDKSCWKFFWKNIICRFGIPKILITDNGKQFDNKMFAEQCNLFGIQQKFTSVYHPQANGQVENVNRTILQGLKRRLEESKGNWPEELPIVLWAYRTTHRTATGETPFSLTYGSEAVIPTEIGEPSLRVLFFNENGNESFLQDNLDLLSEQRDLAAIRSASYQWQNAHYYNRRVRHRDFNVGDLVLRKIQVPDPRQGKLAPNWKGPFQVSKVTGKGSYQLQRTDGTSIPHTWNIVNLKKYYQ
jgi:hypothetical protein